MKKISILFVCEGNICRSPALAAVMKQLAGDRFIIDSCGASGWFLGSPPDKRMQKAAKKRGLILEGKAKLLDPKYFEDFDYIVPVTRALYEILKVKAKENAKKVIFIQEIPDPYYGGDKGFDSTMDAAEEVCKKLLTLFYPFPDTFS